jgi:hypothetical protein
MNTAPDLALAAATTTCHRRVLSTIGIWGRLESLKWPPMWLCSWGSTRNAVFIAPHAYVEIKFFFTLHICADIYPVQKLFTSS